LTYRECSYFLYSEMYNKKNLSFQKFKMGEKKKYIILASIIGLSILLILGAVGFYLYDNGIILKSVENSEDSYEESSEDEATSTNPLQNLIDEEQGDKETLITETADEESSATEIEEGNMYIGKTVDTTIKTSLFENNGSILAYLDSSLLLTFEEQSSIDLKNILVQKSYAQSVVPSLVLLYIGENRNAVYAYDMTFGITYKIFSTNDQILDFLYSGESKKIVFLDGSNVLKSYSLVDKDFQTISNLLGINSVSLSDSTRKLAYVTGLHYGSEASGGDITLRIYDMVTEQELYYLNVYPSTGFVWGNNDTYIFYNSVEWVNQTVYKGVGRIDTVTGENIILIPYDGENRMGNLLISDDGSKIYLTVIENVDGTVNYGCSTITKFGVYDMASNTLTKYEGLINVSQFIPTPDGTGIYLKNAEPLPITGGVKANYEYYYLDLIERDQNFKNLDIPNTPWSTLLGWGGDNENLLFAGMWVAN